MCAKSSELCDFRSANLASLVMCEGHQEPIDKIKKALTDLYSKATADDAGAAPPPSACTKAVSDNNLACIAPDARAVDLGVAMAAKLKTAMDVISSVPSNDFFKAIGGGLMCGWHAAV